MLAAARRRSPRQLQIRRLVIEAASDVVPHIEQHDNPWTVFAAPPKHEYDPEPKW